MFKEVKSGTGTNKLTQINIFVNSTKKKILYKVTHTLIIYSSFLCGEFINNGVGSTHPQIKFKMCYSKLICFVVLQQKLIIKQLV